MPNLKQSLIFAGILFGVLSSLFFGDFYPFEYTALSLIPSTNNEPCEDAVPIHTIFIESTTSVCGGDFFCHCNGKYFMPVRGGCPIGCQSEPEPILRVMSDLCQAASDTAVLGGCPLGYTDSGITNGYPDDFFGCSDSVGCEIFSVRKCVLFSSCEIAW